MATGAGLLGAVGRIRPPRHLRRLAWVLAFAAAAVVVAGAPVRGWWAQRAEIERADTELAQLLEDNAALESRLDRMRDPAEVQRMARSEMGMVLPGEESYSVLPPATSGLVMPDTWPFDRIAPALLDAAEGP